MMNFILLIILLSLLIYTTGMHGMKLFFSLCLNFVLIVISFSIIAIGIDARVIALLTCFIIGRVVLYFLNGDNVKTKASTKSIIVVLLLLIISIFVMVNISKIGGFSEEAYEEINMFEYEVGLKFSNISIAMILMCLIGAVIDSSVAISSALYEVHINNKELSKKELFNSGINIGKDILCTTLNTLLFAFIAEFMTLLIYYKTSSYTFLDIINSKLFSSEIIKITFSAIGCIIIIPVTSYITSKEVKNINE